MTGCEGGRCWGLEENEGGLGLGKTFLLRMNTEKGWQTVSKVTSKKDTCTVDWCENHYFSLLNLALRENNLLYIPRSEIKTVHSQVVGKYSHKI